MFQFRIAIAVAAAAVLGACASTPAAAPDFQAKNRPLEERCVRGGLHKDKSASGGPKTQAEVQAEARAAAQRGELDPACNWL
jgi:hypothetical protein